MSEHGTNARYTGGACRCAACLEAGHKYNREYKQARRAGQVFRKDTAESRRHIDRMRRRGLTLTAIARAAGVSKFAVQRLAAGKTSWVSVGVHEAVLGVTLDDATLRPGWMVRLLAAHIERAGVDKAKVAAAMHMPVTNYRRAMAHDRHTALTLDKFIVVYRYLAGQGIVPASVLEEVT